jgi:dTDP-4-dehydrorhamnose reductase
VSWVFGTNGTNFVKTMLRLGRERAELRIVADQLGGPTEARDVADAIVAIAEAVRRPGFAGWGIYHFTGAPGISRHSFAAAIFAGTGRPAPRLVAVATRDYPAPAPRPLNALLDCGRIRQVFAIDQPDWRTSLMRVLRDLGEGAA